MENGHLHDDKLFQAVSDRLSDYEAPYDGADWDAMSRSLDQLPKSSAFRWKFSLNSALLIIAVAAAGIGAWALMNGNSKNNNEAAAGLTEQSATLPVVNTIADNNAPVPSSVQADLNPADDKQNTSSVMESKTVTDIKKYQHTPSDLRFGDQIDPKKGFVYQTRESDTILQKKKENAAPEVYYDNENGNIKKIIISKDENGLTGSKKAIDTDSLNLSGDKTLSPALDHRLGFGDDDSK
ncbi:MAG: hypothetical protein Fur0041_05530 [Bacteroidia bacterium]